MIVIDTRSIENYVCDGSSSIDNQNFRQKDEWIGRQEKYNETTTGESVIIIIINYIS